MRRKRMLTLVGDDELDIKKLPNGMNIHIAFKANVLKRSIQN